MFVIRIQDFLCKSYNVISKNLRETSYVSNWNQIPLGLLTEVSVPHHTPHTPTPGPALGFSRVRLPLKPIPRLPAGMGQDKPSGGVGRACPQCQAPMASSTPRLAGRKEITTRNLNC